METTTSRSRNVAYQPRNLQDTIGLCPPLVISEAEVDELPRRFARALDETAEALGRR